LQPKRTHQFSGRYKNKALSVLFLSSPCGLHIGHIDIWLSTDYDGLMFHKSQLIGGIK
ncbi:hypothetical protein C5S39_14545, partial [Candidatus Methanophagaceae archaeon]